MQRSGENQGVRPPLPPFDEETAEQEVKAARDAWNTRDPEKVSLAYTPDSKWRNRDEFFEGREEIVAFLKRKWATTAACIEIGPAHHEQSVLGQFLRSSEPSAEIGAGNSRKLA